MSSHSESGDKKNRSSVNKVRKTAVLWSGISFVCLHSRMSHVVDPYHVEGELLLLDGGQTRVGPSTLRCVLSVSLMSHQSAEFLSLCLRQGE